MFKRILPLQILLILVLGLPITHFAQSSLPSSLIDKISASVVLIEAYRDGQPFSTGSGTFVSDDGLIYTNRHVLEGADDFAIYVLEDPNEPPVLTYFASAELVFPNDVNGSFFDFGVLQVNRDANGNALLRNTISVPAIDATEFRELQRGEELYVFGYPGIGDGYLVFTSGIVTTVQNNDVAGSRIPVWYQTSAEIAPGNSGGLVVDSQGRPVGIPTAVRAEERTGGRLGGVLPFDFVQTAVTGGITPEDPLVLLGDAPVANSSSGSGSGATTGDGDLFIEITNVEFDASIPEFNEPVALVTTNIQAIGYQDVALRVGIFFYWRADDGFEPVLTDNADFASPSGAMTEQEVVTPGFEATVFEDFQFAVPMSAFPTVTQDREAVVVGDIAVDGGEFEALSELWPYTVRATGSSSGAGGGGDLAGIDITCPDGQVINDGVEIEVFLMRPGFNYTATVIGIGDFDPVLAVVPTDLISEGQATLCNDDANSASGYRVNLPTTGNIIANSRASQQVFNHSNSDMMSISLIVGEFNRNAGEFVIVLEGMASTSADGAGDPFIVRLTPNVNASERGIAAYMIGAESQIDPLFYVSTVNDFGEPLVLGGEALSCDDGGDSSICYGTSASLDSSSVMVAGSRVINADARDPMLSLVFNFDDIQTLDDSLVLPFVMTTFNRASTGRYITAFHIGVE